MVHLIWQTGLYRPHPSDPQGMRLQQAEQHLAQSSQEMAYLCGQLQTALQDLQSQIKILEKRLDEMQATNAS